MFCDEQTGANRQIIEGYGEATKRQFSKMIDPVEYDGLLKSNERRISHKAMLSALMISLYHEEPCFHQPYEILNLIMDIDALMMSWRCM